MRECPACSHRLDIHTELFGCEYHVGHMDDPNDVFCGCMAPFPTWEHAYESGPDLICINCGLVGSYIHTPPEQR